MVWVLAGRYLRMAEHCIHSNKYSKSAAAVVKGRSTVSITILNGRSIAGLDGGETLNFDV